MVLVSSKPVKAAPTTRGKRIELIMMAVTGSGFCPEKTAHTSPIETGAAPTTSPKTPDSRSRHANPNIPKRGLVNRCTEEAQPEFLARHFLELNQDGWRVPLTRLHQQLGGPSEKRDLDLEPRPALLSLPAHDSNRTSLLMTGQLMQLK